MLKLLCRGILDLFICTNRTLLKEVTCFDFEIIKSKFRKFWLLAGHQRIINPPHVFFTWLRSLQNSAVGKVRLYSVPYTNSISLAKICVCFALEESTKAEHLVVQFLQYRAFITKLILILFSKADNFIICIFFLEKYDFCNMFFTTGNQTYSYIL